MNPDEKYEQQPTPETLEATADEPREDEAPTSPDGAPAKRGRPRGFAAMSRDRVIEIARLGGRAAHAAGTAHEFTTDEAREAGRKGGAAPHVRRGAPPKAKPRDLDAPPPSV